MRHRIGAAVLTAAWIAAATAPSLANGAASTRNIILFGAAAGVLVTNYNHKVRAKREELHEVIRRQAAYRDWYYQRYGYYPTQSQFETWYRQTYGVDAAE